MSQIFKILVFLIYFLLAFSNQRQFSLLVDNLIPVRLILIIFLIASFLFYIYKEKQNSFRYLVNFIKSDKVFLFGVLIFLWRALSLTQAADLRLGVVMLGFWGSVIAFYFLGSFLLKSKSLSTGTHNKGICCWKLISWSLVGLLSAAAVSVATAFYQTIAFVGWGIQRFDLWGWQYPDGFRVPGLMLDSNHFGIFMVAAFLIVTSLFLVKRQYFLAVTSSFLILSAYSLSSSRSALLGLLFGCLFLLVILAIKKQWKILLAFIIVAIIGISSGTVISKVIDVYTQNYVKNSVILHTEVSSLTNAPAVNESIQFGGIFEVLNKVLPTRVQRVFDASAMSHVGMLVASWNLGLRFPILGVGYGNFSNGLKSQTDLFSKASISDPRGLSQASFPSHTLWGEQLAETGFIGLILYTLLVGAILLRILKEKTVISYFFAALWVGFLVFSIFYAANEEFFWLLPFLGIWHNQRSEVGGQKSEL